MYANPANAAKTYRDSEAHHVIDSDDAYGLIQKLLGRLIGCVGVARHALGNDDIASKGEQIGKAIEILSLLQVALDYSHNRQLAENLANLYDYCSRQLLHANLHNDDAILAEVVSLLREVKEAWDSIAPSDGAA
ncbi:MAG: flagellar export chaperone FliS [Pseudomonadota bacterium]